MQIQHSLDQLEALEQPHDLQYSQDLDDAQNALVPNRIDVNTHLALLQSNHIVLETACD